MQNVNTVDRRTFRTPGGVLVIAETVQGGARVYSPVVSAWARVLNDRRVA